MRHVRPILSSLMLATVLSVPAAAAAKAGPHIDVSNAGRCDFIDPQSCLMPWPNDYFTVADKTTDTGRRLHLNKASMPANKTGVHIDPAGWNKNDGFSPGQEIVAKIPGFDTPAAYRKTNPVGLTTLKNAFAKNAPIVVINTKTGKRQLIWTELDPHPKNPKNVVLEIRAGVNYDENTRYIVALRNLKNGAGKLIPPSPAFRIYRDALTSTQPAVNRRRAHMESIFKTLAKAGIARQDLTLAWDFTVGSERSLSERFLHIRDDAFKQLGDTNLADLKVKGSSPSFAVTQVENFTPAENDKIARRVRGTFNVPCYLDMPKCPSGAGFRYSSATSTIPLRTAGNTFAANFICNIPRVALDPANPKPARPALYGHGLLGSADEVNQGQLQSMDNEHNIVSCGTDWAGFAHDDIPFVAGVLQDLSKFPRFVDRTQQGWLDFLYLGRTMIHAQGFGTNAAFQTAAGRSVFNTARLFYDGNSQGGILGGGLTAVAPDFDRGTLGVPGMNFSLLLRRSVDFDTYAQVLYGAYTSELERELILSLLQDLWDRSEADGYAHHMTTDPLPNTPQHRVLMHPAIGDHQVSQFAALVEARTIGAALRTPTNDPGRIPPGALFGLKTFSKYPYNGSAIVFWDTGPIHGDHNELGTPPAPTDENPPRKGTDPHEEPRRAVEARQQKSAFLQIGGKVINTCSNHPCYAAGWLGSL